MSDEKSDSVFYTFRNPCRIVFEHVVKAEAYKENGVAKGEPRFDLTVIVPPDSPDLAALKSLVAVMARANNPGKKLVPRRLTQEELDDGGTVEISVPWKDGNKAADQKKAAKNGADDFAFLRDHFTIKAASKYAPVLSGIEGGKIVTYDNPDTRATLTKLFYPGAYVVPHVQLHAYKARDNKPGGVGLWLPSVCFIKNGPRIGGSRANPAEIFKGYAGQTSAVDPTGGEMDDDIPL